jgi:hypothetical protein
MAFRNIYTIAERLNLKGIAGVESRQRTGKGRAEMVHWHSGFIHLCGYLED